MTTRFEPGAVMKGLIWAGLELAAMISGQAIAADSGRLYTIQSTIGPAFMSAVVLVACGPTPRDRWASAAIIPRTL
jgi:hypothetical protein